MSRLSNLKSSNALYYVMAGLYKKQLGIEDCLVLNTEGRIAEAISSNIFLIRGNELFTPGLEEACVAGVMREYIIEHERLNGRSVQKPASRSMTFKSRRNLSHGRDPRPAMGGGFPTQTLFQHDFRKLLNAIQEAQTKRSEQCSDLFVGTI